jgi:hypothetical protein
MQEMVTLKGGCLCGAVRYEWRGASGSVSATYCHCPDCRKATGGPYTVGVRVDAAGLTILSGQARGYTKIADSGRWITREFCPECGSPLFTRGEKYPDVVSIKAGSLDTPELIEPTHQTWTAMAVPWAYLDKGLPSFPQNGPAPGGKAV